RSWDLIPRGRPFHDQASLATLYPAFTRNPSDWFACAAVQQSCGVFLGQRLSPFPEALFGEVCALRMRILKGTMEFVAPATVKLVANGFGDELTAVLLPAVDFSDEVDRDGYSHPLEGSHSFHTVDMIIS